MIINPKEYYNSDYWNGKKIYKDHDGTNRQYRGPGLEWEGFDTIAKLLNPLLPKGKLLDIGCGGGALMKRLSNGRLVTGLEISQHAIDNCLPEMESKIILGDISDSNLGYHDHDKILESTEFDAIIATDLMEHIYEEDLQDVFANFAFLANQESHKKTIIFLLIATTDGEEFIAKKGEPIPPKWELTAVSGHVNVRSWKYWVRKFRENHFTIRYDLMWRFQAEKDKIPWLNEMLAWGGNNTFFLEL